jgi:hypothetical protein
LQHLPLAAEGEQEPLGEVQGVIIDISTRRVRYFVVEAHTTGQKCLVSLDATCVDKASGALERVGGELDESHEPFDASRVGRFDDDAVLSLLFGRHAA